MDSPSMSQMTDDPLEFPTFEAFDQDDRPPAPSEEDFPVGCTVELVDVTTAKLAQTDNLWEPFMDDLFRKPKRRVVVKRHVGEYAFVVCDDDPEYIIGCSLYRACLKEPKVKFRKYVPTEEAPNGIVAPPVVPTVESNDDGLFTMIETNDDESDMLARPLSELPDKGTASHAPESGADFMTEAAPQHNHSAAAAAPAAPTSTVTAANASKARKFVRQGNAAFSEGRFTEAVTAYTQALELDKVEQSRVLSNRSAAYLSLKNPENALADARQVMNMTPRSHVGYVRAGNVLRMLKRYDEARLCYERALQLDPNRSKDIEHSLLCNAVAAVYRNKTEHLPIGIHLSPTRTIYGVAKKSFREHDVVWSESTKLICPLRQEDTAVCCAQCHRSLLRSEAIAEHSGLVDAQTIHTLHRDLNIIHCHEGCGASYCSDNCRAKSWTDHHWVECPTKGHWGSACSNIKKVMQQGVERVGTELVASVRLTFRMLACIVSSSKSLSDAVNMFTWLRAVKNLSQDEQNAVEHVLKPAHDALLEVLSREERQLLDMRFVLRLFRQCRMNCIAVLSSRWGSLRSSVETHLALLREKGRTHQGLEALLTLDPKTIPGAVVPCIAFFEIYSVLTEGSNAAGTAIQPPNTDLRHRSEAPHMLTAISISAIEKGGVLSAVRQSMRPL